MTNRKAISISFIVIYALCLVIFPLITLADLWLDPLKVGNAADWYLAVGAPLLFVWGYLDHRLRENEKKNSQAEQNAKAIGIELISSKVKNLDKEKWIKKQIRNNVDLNNTDAEGVVKDWPTSFTGNAVVKKEIEFELFNLGNAPVYELKIDLIFHDRRIYFPVVGINDFGYFYPKEGEIDTENSVHPFWQKAQTTRIELAMSILRHDKTQQLVLEAVQEQELFPHTEIVLTWRDDENFTWRRSWDLSLNGRLTAEDLSRINP